LLQNVFHLIFGGEILNNLMLGIFRTNKKVDYIMITLIWIKNHPFQILKVNDVFNVIYMCNYKHCPFFDLIYGWHSCYVNVFPSMTRARKLQLYNSREFQDLENFDSSKTHPQLILLLKNLWKISCNFLLILRWKNYIKSNVVFQNTTSQHQIVTSKTIV
jgi:hypothetical protein